VSGAKETGSGGSAQGRVGEDPALAAVKATALTTGMEHARLLLRAPEFLVGAGVLLLWVLCAVLGDSFRPADPLAQNLLVANVGPSAAHLLGTDSLGRDVLSRVIVGARQILVVAPTAALLGTILGGFAGLLQGFYGGVVDLVTGRVVEAFLALPLVMVTFVFMVAFGTSIPTLVLVIGFAFSLPTSRTIRTAVIQECDLDYIAAARMRGERPLQIMLQEILPNVTSPIIVEFTVRLGYAVFVVATLSFLGFGVQPPTPDWGADIAANYLFLTAGYWWESLFSALAIASLITAINLLSDSIEAVLGQ
jgi:peptide/nickel transport system permease protein